MNEKVKNWNITFLEILYIIIWYFVFQIWSQAKSLGHGFKAALQLINPVSLFRFDAVSKISKTGEYAACVWSNEVMTTVHPCYNRGLPVQEEHVYIIPSNFRIHNLSSMKFAASANYT